MEKEYALSEVEAAVASMEELAMLDDDVMEEDASHQILVSKWHAYVPGIGLDLHEGSWCAWDEEEGCFTADFSVTVIKEHGKAGYLYWEQDGFLAAMANYMRQRFDLEAMDMATLGQLMCLIQVPED